MPLCAKPSIPVTVNRVNPSELSRHRRCAFELISQAGSTPVEPRRRAAKATGLAALGIALTASAAMPYIQGTLPSCDSAEVISLTEKIIQEAPLVRMSGLKLNGIVYPVELGYDWSTETRTCKGILKHSQGEEAIGFQVEWHDPANRVIWVKVVPL